MLFYYDFYVKAQLKTLLAVSLPVFVAIHLTLFFIFSNLRKFYYIPFYSF